MSVFLREIILCFFFCFSSRSLYHSKFVVILKFSFAFVLSCAFFSSLVFEVLLNC